MFLHLLSNLLNLNLHQGERVGVWLRKDRQSQEQSVQNDVKTGFAMWKHFELTFKLVWRKTMLQSFLAWNAKKKLPEHQSFITVRFKVASKCVQEQSLHGGSTTDACSMFYLMLIIPFMHFNFYDNKVYVILFTTKGLYGSVLPRIMNFGRIRIPNNIRIFKNDEYEYYSEFEKLFEYYSWEIFE